MFNKIQNWTDIEGIKLMFISRNSQLINYIKEAEMFAIFIPFSRS